MLRESPLGAALTRAHARGATIAGCSAGAMAIVGRTMDVRVHPEAADPAPVPDPLAEGLSLVDGVAVLPHYDALARAALRASSRSRRRAASIVLGIDEDTAVVGRNGAWQVHGAGRVTVWRGRRRERFRSEGRRVPRLLPSGNASMPRQAGGIATGVRAGPVSRA